MRVGQRAPLSVNALPLNLHVAKGQARRALEIVDLVIIFAVRTQAHKAHRLRLGKFQQRPRFFLRTIRCPRPPGHRAVFAIVDAAHRRAPALRHVIRPAHLRVARSQRHVALLGIRPEQLQFIHTHVRRFEVHLDRLKLCRAEMHLAIAAPILLPRAGASQLFAFTVNRLEQRLAALTPRMVRPKLRRAAPELDALKHRRHGVVVINRNRIKLVIVTTRAIHGEAKQRGTHRLDDLIHAIRARLPDGLGDLPDGRWRHMRSAHEKAGGLPAPQRVTRQLLAHKLVVRQVIVEGAHHIVAVHPRHLAVKIRLGTIRLRPANDIQPMLRPAFAKVFGRQLLLDQTDVRLLRILRIPRLKRLHLLRRRRQTGEHNRNAPDQFLGGRLAIGLHPRLGQARIQERIDLVAPHRWGLGPIDRSE